MSTIDMEPSTEYNSFKRLEFVLNNKTESFPNKVESLVEVWKQVSQCRLTEHKQYVVHLMDWLKLHTLNIVLTGDWKKFKDIYEEKLLKEVKHCEMLLLHSNNIFSLRCRKLAEVIKDPWGSPILNRLLNDPDVVIGAQEIEFFCIETGYLISTRLRKLCESHCEDLALNLVGTFMRCHQMAEAQQFTLNATDDQRRFILDVYIALLYKYKRTALIISTLKSLTLKEGLDLLRRFAHKRVNISKIWRHSNRIAHLAAQVYITATVLKPPEESISILEELLETWFTLNETSDNFDSLMAAIRRIIQPAESAVHLYIFCESVYKKFGVAMKTFTIELYIRALTTGMNELERQKNEDDSEKVVETTRQLADGFLRLAEVLEEHLKVSRECVLTSFSLLPTQETLEKLIRLAERSGYEVLDTGQNWKCKLHPPITRSDEICWKCDLCGDYMSQPQYEPPLNTNTALNEALTAEQLGLSSQLCDDLVVVLSSPRYQLFNWLLRWQDLHRLCMLYLNDPEGTKNLVTELKFLDIDYSMFVGMKREPEDEELTGIERGYEHYLEDELYPEERVSSTSEDSFSQDSRPYSLGSDGMGEHGGLLPIPPSGKSDPNVLKSLRLFRPNLKRSKPSQLESVLPPKVFVTSKSVSPLATAHTTISTPQHHVAGVGNLSALMDKYIGAYNLLPPPQIAKSPHTTALPTYSAAHRNVKNDNFHTLMDKYLGYDTSRNVPSSHTPSRTSSHPVNWDAYGQCSSTSSSDRSSIVANSYPTQENIRSNTTRTGFNFFESNSNSQDTHSANNSKVNNPNIETPRKQSMKQMFSEMEQALNYLKQQKKELSVTKVVKDNCNSKTINEYLSAASEQQQRKDSSVSKDNSNIHKNTCRTLNQYLSAASEQQQRKDPSVSKDNSNIHKNSCRTLNEYLSAANEQQQRKDPSVSKDNSNIHKNSCKTLNEYLFAPSKRPQQQELSEPLNFAKDNNSDNQKIAMKASPSKEQPEPHLQKTDLSISTKLAQHNTTIQKKAFRTLNEYLAGTSKQSPQKQDRSEPLNFSKDDSTNNQQNTSRILNEYFSSRIAQSEPKEENKDLSTSTKLTITKNSKSECRTLNDYLSAPSRQPQQLKQDVSEPINFTKDSNHSRILNDYLKKPPESQAEKKDLSLSIKKHTCRILNEYLSSPSKAPQQPEKFGSIENKKEGNEQKCKHGENSKPQNFLLDHKSSDSPEWQSLELKKYLTSPDSTQKQTPAEVTKITTTQSIETDKNNPTLDEENHTKSAESEKKNSTIVEKAKFLEPQKTNSTITESRTKLIEEDKNCPTLIVSAIEQTKFVELEKNNLTTSNCTKIKTDTEKQIKSIESEKKATIISDVPEKPAKPIEPEKKISDHLAESKKISKRSSRKSSRTTSAPLRSKKSKTGPTSPSCKEYTCIDLSNKMERLPSANTEEQEKDCITKQYACIDLRPDNLPPKPEDIFYKFIPGAVKPVPPPPPPPRSPPKVVTLTIPTKNLIIPSLPVRTVPPPRALAGTVLPTPVTDMSKNLTETGTGCIKHKKPEKTILPPVTDKEEATSPNVEILKNVLLSPSGDKNDVNISKNLISASSGTENSENLYTSPIPHVDNSKTFVTVETLDAKQREYHCLHNIKTIGYKSSTKKRFTQETENVIPKNAPKMYSRKYRRAKHSASNISDYKTGLEGNKLTDWKKKFNLKEVHVILHRLTLPESNNKKYVKPASKFVKPDVPRRKQPKRDQKKNIETSENKTNDEPTKKEETDKSKKELKPWPLQDINPKVNRRKDTTPLHIIKDNKCKTDLKTDTKIMNPCVLLKRLEFDKDKDKKRSANSVLANVPGLNDLQMIRPSSVDRIVQVVQVPGVRNTTNVPIQSTQTSTQVTPHIQRIGQPRTEKPEASIPDSTSITSTAASSTSTTTTVAESPAFINILSQQIIRPGTQSNCVSVRPRTSPHINILSQQIIKPATSIPSAVKVSSSGSTEVQVNSIPRVISSGDQILSQLINPVRAPAPTLKTLVNAPASDHNRIVQFICKSSDGKLIPVTSFTSNKVVKVSMTQTVSTSVAGNTSVDENLAKVAQTPNKAKTDAENPDTLPKFQQAFGKPAYQNNIDSTESVTSNSDNVNSDLEKSVNIVKTQPKNSSTSLNVQPVQGGVIYTRQMPVGQTINLIPPGRGQVFRIATSNAEQLSLVKDTVIHGKMSALLAAALQGKQRTVDGEIDITSDENSQNTTRVALTTRPTLVQNARIVKPVLQIPSNVIRSTPQTNLSSTTLEQLREFDMVYKQVKERSSTSAPTESSPQSDTSEPTQQISVTYLNQGQKINCAPVVVVSSYCNVQPAASPSLSVTSQGSSSPCVTPAPTLSLSKTVSKSPKAKSVKSTTTHTTKASPIPKPQQKPQEDEHTTQRIFDILAEYAEQLRNSPDLNNKPAPRRRSNPPTNPNQNAKRKKSSSSKKTGHCSNSMTSDGDLDDTHTVGSEDSSCGVVQISVQDEEQQLATVSTSEASEASVSPKQLILTDSAPNQSRSLIIADSNVGEALKMSNTAVLVPGNYIMPVSMVKGGQQIAVVSGGSKILATVPARSGPNMLLFQSFLNQTRKHGLPTVKYSAVQPISGIARNLSSVTAQLPAAVPPTSQNLTAVTLAQTVALQKVNHLERTDINSFDTELLLTIAHPSENKNNILEQPQLEHRVICSSSENVQKIIRVGDSIQNTESSLEKAFVYEQKTLANTSVATSVIAQSVSIKEEKLSEEQSTTQTIMALNLNSSDSDKDTTIKVEGRVQSVLVATGTSNGPMLFNSPPTYTKQADCTNSISESNKDEYLRSEGKRNSNEAKSLQSTVYAYQGKIRRNQPSSHRLDREVQPLSLQEKQAALERELRFQKSLSEECEDLGVDEPSTSDLFPEADLLFDSNHSPSFDHSSQDLVKRPQNTQEVKEETKTIGLFCDDEPMRTDFLFEPIEFQSTAVELDYNRARDMTNGQGSTSNESGFSCEDNTLLQTCTSMSDVTIPSPISPDPYTDNSPPPLNKCKYKYSNRKKVDRSKHVENWPMELSSSEDTTGSTELTKSCSRSPEIYPGRRNRSLSCEEDDRDLIGFAIVERLPLKEDEECEELHCQEAVDCPSGRGARRSVKKLCSCCNGSTKVARKRPASRPPTPFSHKKTVIAKKR